MIVTLSPIMQEMSMVPASMRTLLPMIVGPWINAVGSILQLRPTRTNAEQERKCLRSISERSRILSLTLRELDSLSTRRAQPNAPNSELASNTWTQLQMGMNAFNGTW